MRCLFLPGLVLASALGLGVATPEAATFRVVTYNLENYVVQPTATRTVKPPESRAKVHQLLCDLNPEVLAVQEIGAPDSLAALREGLKAGGLDLPYQEHVTGFDTNVFVAVLSKYPISARRSHTNENFLLNGRRFRTSRGFAEVDIQVGTNYTFTLFTAHLKSKRIIPEADEAEMRLAEARILRGKIDACLSSRPEANIVVLGDFNDTMDTPAIRALVGRGQTKLTDLRPAERNGDNLPNRNPAWEPRNISWTHHFGKEDSYSRIDYILTSPGMAREWVPTETYIHTAANWGLASDHRPLVATFEIGDK